MNKLQTARYISINDNLNFASVPLDLGELGFCLGNQIRKLQSIFNIYFGACVGARYNLCRTISTYRPRTFCSGLRTHPTIRV